MAIQFDDLTDNGILTIEEYLLSESITLSDPQNLEQLEAFRKALYGSMRLKQSSASKDLKERELETISQINAFIHADARILKDFPDWGGDVMNIEASLKSLTELEDLFKTYPQPAVSRTQAAFQGIYGQKHARCIDKFQNLVDQ